MREAFTYMFKDPGIKDKATTYIIICFIAFALTALPEISQFSGIATTSPYITPVTTPSFELLAFCGKLLNLVLLGYSFTCVGAIIKQNQNIVLPFLNIWNSFVKGFKFNVGIILLLLPLILLIFLFSLLSKFATIIFTILVFLLFIIIGNSFIWTFANENKISIFFDLKRIFRYIAENKKTYFKNLLFIILIGIVSAIISVLFMLLFNLLINNVYLAWILTSLEGAIIATYTFFVSIYLIAKSINPQTVV